MVKENVLIKFNLPVFVYFFNVATSRKISMTYVACVCGSHCVSIGQRGSKLSHPQPFMISGGQWQCSSQRQGLSSQPPQESQPGPVALVSAVSAQTTDPTGWWKSAWGQRDLGLHSAPLDFSCIWPFIHFSFLTHKMGKITPYQLGRHSFIQPTFSKPGTVLGSGKAAAHNPEGAWHVRALFPASIAKKDFGRKSTSYPAPFLSPLLLCVRTETPLYLCVKWGW